MSQQNAIGWFDIYVKDMERATKFYEAILNQKLEKLEDPTGETEMMIFPADMKSYGASGALVKSPHSNPGVGGTMVYFSVKDCNIEGAKVAKAGGKLVRPKFSIGDFGWVTLLEDSEGNLFGLNSMT
ncbi:VOC family protein [Leptospira sp. GIMC2001]|uniref:VOC family protein n=1 Tax=Leptospira sp. GIMC2001 TaxID=1513297 RepID=UPI00234BDA39|nr:VOC family protein [Leptospira sp. GIMC2001]WCL50320.1 VOC family protein [Leptospira sp. GIMC2001]